MLTSGSTGRPKAVRVGGGALAAFVTDAVRRYRWRPGDRVVQFAPLHADTSVEEIFVTLAAGAALVTTRPADRGSPSALLGLAARSASTVLDLPTAVWHELAVALDSRTVTIPATVRMVVIGGEEVSPELVSRWQRCGGPLLHNSYGPSEAAIVCVSADLVPGAAPPVPLGELFPHIGAALAVDRLAAEPDHHRGVLHLYGPMLADGYLPAREGSGFRKITVGPNTVRAFATGDRVRVRDDGSLEFLERVDGTVKIGGRRVGVRAIEDALRREPDIRDAVITRRGEFALDALVTVSGPRPAGWPTAVRQWLAEQLPPAWIPARIRVVDTLPRTRNLKADRAAVVAAEPASGTGARRALEIFAEILGRDDLTASDDFFAAGGTSMQTIALANRLAIALGVPVTVDDVLARPTAAELAEPTHRSQEQDPDLAAECAFLRAELAATPPAVVRDGPVLLTGATGFLGAYLLAELLESTTDEVIVAVRADSAGHARHRLRAAFTAIAAAEVFDTAWQSGRMRAVAGELTELSGRADSFGAPSRIVHSAAEVSAVRSYHSLRAANVVPTTQLLRLARSTAAAFTLISTATAAGARGVLSDPSALPTGYAQSKSVAEHLLATAAEEFDLTVTIARPGRVLPHPADTRGARGDFLHDLVAAVTAVGAVPRTTLREPVIRADDLARLVFAPAPGPPARSPRILDLFGPEPVAIAEVLSAVTTAPVAPLAEWRGLVAAYGQLAPPRRAAVLRWCDIQLAGFDHEWLSDHSAPVPPRSAAEVAELLGLAIE